MKIHGVFPYPQVGKDYKNDNMRKPGLSGGRNGPDIC